MDLKSRFEGFAADAQLTIQAIRANDKVRSAMRSFAPIAAPATTSTPTSRAGAGEDRLGLLSILGMSYILASPAANAR